MSELKKLRETRNLTQEELAEKSGLSVRTIQRVEAGMKPKGYTLKVLALSLDVPEKELWVSDMVLPQEIKIEEIPATQKKKESASLALVKLINLSSLPLAWFPVLNFIPPLVIMFFTKKKSKVIKQIISLQIFLAVIFPLIFMIVVLFKPGHSVVLAVMILLVLINIYMILRNAYEIDKREELYYKLNFSIL